MTTEGRFAVMCHRNDAFQHLFNRTGSQPLRKTETGQQQQQQQAVKWTALENMVISLEACGILKDWIKKETPFGGISEGRYMLHVFLVERLNF